MRPRDVERHALMQRLSALRNVRLRCQRKRVGVLHEVQMATEEVTLMEVAMIRAAILSQWLSRLIKRLHLGVGRHAIDVRGS